MDVVFLCGTGVRTQISPFCSVKAFHAVDQPFYQAVNESISNTPVVGKNAIVPPRAEGERILID
jgi:hypothetical protein